ncbi:MAG: hypothetical protein AB2L07_05320 [Thermoanaerobaculaceae bacterium]
MTVHELRQDALVAGPEAVDETPFVASVGLGRGGWASSPLYSSPNLRLGS